MADSSIHSVRPDRGKLRRDIVVGLVIVLMYLAEWADDRYTKRIYTHKQLPHGWDNEGSA